MRWKAAVAAACRLIVVLLAIAGREGDQGEDDCWASGPIRPELWGTSPSLTAPRCSGHTVSRDPAHAAVHFPVRHRSGTVTAESSPPSRRSVIWGSALRSHRPVAAAWRHYGWRVLAACFVILFLNSGARMVFGPMLKPMVEDLGWTRGMLSAAVLVNAVVSAVSILLMGRLYDRFGPRPVILASTLLFSAGYLLMSVMGAYWQFLFLYGVVVGIGVGGTTAPVFGAVLSKWFDRWRGLAISMGLAGVSLGQFALVPPFSAFMLGNGWRLTLLLIALVTVAVNVPLVLFVIRGDPEALGVEPFGAASAAGPADVEQGVWADRPAAGVEQTAAPSVVGATRPACSGTVSAGGDLSLRQAVATRSFWLFTAAMFVCGSGDFLLTTHLAAMATDHGYSPATGAGLLAWFGLMSMVGLLLAGPASDLVGNKIPMAAAFAIRVVVFALILRSQNLASFYVLALGFGLTFLVTAPLTPTLSGRLYGFAAVGAIGGLVTTFHHIGGGMFAYLGGVVFDRTGDYSIAFAVALVASAIALVCTLLIREERHAAPATAPAFELAARGDAVS